ncbi:hypothetical protein OUZ56_002701 [Daphnia magna]|uniref:Uncharacterized protein n=1 Tax=Daphnia magna TaxID=35525 RepID=A0ABR0A6J3_9CRUS|nr:hypothetical protein OUZ56_002701 [Daphnia magna]
MDIEQFSSGGILVAELTDTGFPMEMAMWVLSEGGFHASVRPSDLPLKHEPYCMVNCRSGQVRLVRATAGSVRVCVPPVLEQMLHGGEASIWDLICQLLVEMAEEHGLESWRADSYSGTFSSVQATNNVQEIYPHQTWSLFWLTDLLPVRPKFSRFQRLLSASEKVERR